MDLLALREYIMHQPFENPRELHELMIQCTPGTPEQRKQIWEQHLDLSQELDHILQVCISREDIMRCYEEEDKHRSAILYSWVQLSNLKKKPRRRSARLNGKRVQVKFK